MRYLPLFLVLLLTACACNPTRSQPDIPTAQDYAEVSGYRIEKAGVTTPIYHLYIQGKYGGTNEWWSYEKLSDQQADGSHLRFRQGFIGLGSVFATYTADAARRLLDALHSPEALADGRRYNWLSDNSNEWVKDRLKQAGLKADLPRLAVGE